MKKEFFVMQSPFEIGDRVAVIRDDGGARDATITDIAFINLIRGHSTAIRYELDNSGRYVPIDLLDRRREGKG